jgi:hypothetical protein
MTCKPELESEEAWRAFLEKASELEAWEALSDVLRLARRYAKRSEKTSRRLDKLFESGAAIYAERFGKEWVPF